MELLTDKFPKHRKERNSLTDTASTCFNLLNFVVSGPSRIELLVRRKNGM